MKHYVCNIEKYTYMEIYTHSLLYTRINTYVHTPNV